MALTLLKSETRNEHTQSFPRLFMDTRVVDFESLQDIFEADITQENSKPAQVIDFPPAVNLEKKPPLMGWICLLICMLGVCASAFWVLEDLGMTKSSLNDRFQSASQVLPKVFELQSYLGNPDFLTTHPDTVRKSILDSRESLSTEALKLQASRAGEMLSIYHQFNREAEQLWDVSISLHRDKIAAGFMYLYSTMPLDYDALIQSADLSFTTADALLGRFMVDKDPALVSLAQDYIKVARSELVRLPLLADIIEQPRRLVEMDQSLLAYQDAAQRLRDVTLTATKYKEETLIPEMQLFAGDLSSLEQSYAPKTHMTEISFWPLAFMGFWGCAFMMIWMRVYSSLRKT